MKTLSFCNFLLITTMVLMLAGCDTFDSVGVPSPQEQQALATSDHLIVPGQRIGPIRLGMGMDEVTQALGQPTRTFWADQTTIGWLYYPLNLQIFYKSGAAPHVIEIATTVYYTGKEGDIDWASVQPATAVFQTTQGIKLGSSSFDVQRAYNYDQYKDWGFQMAYEQLGVYFIVSNDHRVVKISIRPPL